MSIKLTSKANTSPATTQDPYGTIKDKTSTVAGTPLNKAVHNDMHIFFERLKDIAGITDNGLLDNATNGFQTYEALSKTIAVPLFYQLMQQAGTYISHTSVGANLAMVFGYGVYNDGTLLKSISLVLVYYQGEIFYLSDTNRTIGGTVTYTNNNGIRVINNLPASINIIQLPSNHTFTKTLGWSDIEEVGSWYVGNPTTSHSSINLKFYVKNGVCQVVGSIRYQDSGAGATGIDIVFNIINIPRQKYNISQNGIVMYNYDTDKETPFSCLLTSVLSTQKIFCGIWGTTVSPNAFTFNINFSYQVADDWYKDFD